LGYEDLAGEEFVLWPRVDSPDGYDRIVAGCRRAGYEPRIAAETSNAQTMPALVEAGVGLSILGSTLGGFEQSGVTFVPLSDEHRQTEPAPSRTGRVVIGRQLANRRLRARGTLHSFSMPPEISESSLKPSE
jgi:DNA-binding transcriptional LysR family regulator